MLGGEPCTVTLIAPEGNAVVSEACILFQEANPPKGLLRVSLFFYRLNDVLCRKLLYSVDGGS